MGRNEALLATVRRARQRLAVDGPAHTRAELDFEKVSLPSSDCDVLRDLLIGESAHTVIEIGLAYGSSALAIAEALIVSGARRPTHLIIDAYQDRFGDVGWQAITGAGLTDICTLRRERSQRALPGLVEAGFVADAAFVDGSHIFHNVFVDLYYLRELVRPGGLLLLDDCDWPSVATAVRYFERNAGWKPAPAPAPSPERQTRLQAWRLPDPVVEPRFEDFRPF